MINTIIEKFKQRKKSFFLNLHEGYAQKYAFIGVGSHSISNLYPTIWFLGIPIEIIFSRTKANAEKMAQKMQASATDSIEQIVTNQNISGVFISSLPAMHYALIRKMLEASKHVFVEKPPCTTLEELKELIKIQKAKNRTCQVGLQRRFSPVYKKLKQICRKADSYIYHYHTGAYPEGNALFDLFIHPLDILVFLHGSIVHSDIQLTHSDRGMSIVLCLRHSSGTIGSVNLSTMGSWKNIDEYMKVSAGNSVYEVKYPLSLTEQCLQKKILGVPLEKVFANKADIIKTHIDCSFQNPIFEQNSLVMQGYYDEISEFVQMTEGKKNVSYESLEGLLSVYEVFEKIKTTAHS